MQHSITTNAVSHAMWRVVCAFIVALMAVLMLTQKAEASSIRVSCNVYAENRYDPIAFAQHLHRQIGNTSLTNQSTGNSLYTNKATSCPDASWWTNAGWFPVERYEPVPNAIIYYRTPGDQTRVVDIPRGMQLLGKNDPSRSGAEVLYNCGASPGDTAPTQATPPYNCKQNWATQIRFPRCWDGIGIEETDTVYGSTRTSCPATHPYMLPEINYLIRHPNADRKVPNPLNVSMGVDEWGDYTMMHADYFFAAQDEFHKDVDLDGDGRIEHTDGGYSERNLMDLCLREAPDELEFNNERCRAGGLLSWHRAAIDDYYGL
jgi:hypothetical protein